MIHESKLVSGKMEWRIYALQRREQREIPLQSHREKSDYLIISSYPPILYYT